MKKWIIWMIKVAIVIIVFILLLGIYRFNFTNDDIYVKSEQNEWIRYDDMKQRSQ